MKLFSFWVLFFFLTASLGPRAAQAQAAKAKTGPKYYVILMGGQSNMAGMGKVADLKDYAVPGNVKFFAYGPGTGGAANRQRFGPEVGLWQSLHRQFPDKHFLIIKYAIGGSSMLDWAPNYDAEKARITGHARFGNMFEAMFSKVDSLTKVYDTEMLAFLWMQGERDAKIPVAGKDYYPHFKGLIEAVRQRVQAPRLPVLFGAVNPPAEAYPALPQVRRAQAEIAVNMNHTYLIDTEDLPKLPDNLHYNTQGQLTLGERYARQVAQLLKNAK
ncbi:MAG: sialate O-acetylesterase [Adhaeribacter sp.]